VKQAYQPAESPAAEPTAGGFEVQARIDAIRGNTGHPWHQPGHRLYAQAQEEMVGLYRQLHGGPAVSPTAAAMPAAPIGDGSPSPPSPRVFDVPGEQPRTAAELSAMSLPDLSEGAKQDGLSWDPAKLGTIYAVAEREGFVPLVRKALHLIPRITDPAEAIPDEATTRAAKNRQWGPSAPAKWEAVQRGWEFFKATDPETAARLASDASSDHSDWIDVMAELGEEMVNPLTPGGMARVKAKYTPPAKGAR
jgi:hypothetical protein